MEFFTEKELTMQIGHSRYSWPLALLKELIDNALDACERAGILPSITVEVHPASTTVIDNGPGLPESTLRGSLDYTVRVSDKSYHVSPTRGQLGNALKCVWAAPFVIDGQRGKVEVIANGQHYSIDVSLDQIARNPKLELSSEPSDIKTGTSLRVHWPAVAIATRLFTKAGIFMSTQRL
jgi:DNA topoisomerase VI subunit B